MRFRGRNIPPAGNLPPRLQAEVVSDLKTRPEGVRIKHRLGQNSIKMYDKHGSVLRIETTINNTIGFKPFRAPEGKPEAASSWQRMRNGIADLHRRTQLSQGRQSPLSAGDRLGRGHHLPWRTRRPPSASRQSATGGGCDR